MGCDFDAEVGDAAVDDAALSVAVAAPSSESYDVTGERFESAQPMQHGRCCAEIGGYGRESGTRVVDGMAGFAAEPLAL
jgi:hypothetical protein